MFIDDRDERASIKFQDADLLGLSFRINLGVRDIKNSQVEIINRETGKREKVCIKNLSGFIKESCKC